MIVSQPFDMLDKAGAYPIISNFELLHGIAPERTLVLVGQFIDNETQVAEREFVICQGKQGDDKISLVFDANKCAIISDPTYSKQFVIKAVYKK